MTTPQALDVSRETHEKLVEFEGLLKKWNPKINLVAPRTLDELWVRHFSDSLETAKTIKGDVKKWVDLGSGGGFPAILIALVLKERGSNTQLTFIESDQRKSVFLRTVGRTLDLEFDVLAERIEAAEPQQADVVSARALAPLPKLLGYCERHLVPGGTCVLPKGERWNAEIVEAQKSFAFDLEVIPSVTHEGSVNLIIQGLARV